MSYDESMREKARLLYMQGLSKREIQNELEIGSNVTINKWVKNGDWDTQRRQMHDNEVQNVLRQEINQMMLDSQSALAGLKTISDKAIEAIGSDAVSPNKFGETADAYIKSEKFKKEVRSQLLSIQFVHAVANILQEEIDDAQTLNRIGRRIRLLLSSEPTERPALSS
jgi:hypothetical protein